MNRSPGDAENEQLRQHLARSPRLRRLVDLCRPPLPYDTWGREQGQRAFQAQIRGVGGRPPRVLDLGSGEGRDDQLPGLSEALLGTILRTDIKPGGGADFVSDAHRLPLRDNSLDGVIFQGVAEHVPRPWVVAKEIVRVLRPGGVVLCEAPFVQWYHEDPGDYYRFTTAGLKVLFEGCTPLDAGVAIGPVGAALGIFREVGPILFRSPYLYWPAKWLIGWLTYPAILLDRFYRGRPRAHTIALGVYLLARKDGKPS